MNYSGQKKVLCELTKLSKLNAFILLGYQKKTDASILVFKFQFPPRENWFQYVRREYATAMSN